MLSVAINKFQKHFQDSATVLHLPDDKRQLVYIGHIRSRIHSYTIILAFSTLFAILVVASFAIRSTNSLHIVEGRTTHLYQNYQIDGYDRLENRQIVLIIQVAQKISVFRRSKYFISPTQWQTSFAQELDNGHNSF